MPSYPVQRTRYNNGHFLRLSILESRISDISNSMSSLTSIGGGGGWTRSGMVFRVVGSLGDMEHGMNCPYLFWKLKGKRELVLLFQTVLSSFLTASLRVW